MEEELNFKIPTKEELIKLDTWSGEQYKQYYMHVMDALKKWHSMESGYRAVVIFNNITHLLEKNELIRIKKCKYNKEQPHPHYLVSYDGKIAGFRCPYNKKETINEKSKIDGVIDRYKSYPEILWTIEDLERKPDILKKVRCVYNYPLIRYNFRKPNPFMSSWLECMGINYILDLDITDKHTASLFEKEDKWGHSRYDVSFDMLNEISEVLDSMGIKVRIYSSGNGWYLQFERLKVEMNNPSYENLFCDKDDEVLHKIKNKETKRYSEDVELVRKEAIFWKRCAESFKDFKVEYIQPIIEKYQKYFSTKMIEEPYPHQFVKSPYSLHQRLDLIAKPTNLDELNNLSAKGFTTLCTPSYVMQMKKDEFYKEWK